MKKPLWHCPSCKFANYYNKTICYNCAYRRPKPKFQPQQLQLKGMGRTNE